MTSSEDTPQAKDSFELGFGGAAYVTLGVCGFFALLPAVSWLAPIGMALFPEHGAASSSPPSDVLAGAFGIATTIGGILIAPWALPALVLRARQWSGARIVVEKEALVEYDGEWRRTVIPWANAIGARLEWNASTRGRRLMQLAIQVRDRETGAVISAWDDSPGGTDAIRRRLYVSKPHDLERLIKAHHVVFDQPLDARAAADPERPIRPVYVRMLARLGYFLGFAAPLAEYPAPAWGVVLAVLAVLLFALRAEPAFHELFALRRALRAAEHPAASSPVGPEDPYRAMDRPFVTVDPAEIEARKAKIRGVLLEASLRASCIPLTIVATVMSRVAAYQ